MPVIQIGPRIQRRTDRRIVAARRNTSNAMPSTLTGTYDEVISQLGQPAALLIFGPGEAKLQLKARLSGSKALSEHLVGIETTDKMTDPQIVAKVKDHYGIERREDAVGPAHSSKPH